MNLTLILAVVALVHFGLATVGVTGERYSTWAGAWFWSALWFAVHAGVLR